LPSWELQFSKGWCNVKGLINTVTQYHQLLFFFHRIRQQLTTESTYLRNGLARVIITLSLKLACTINISFILFFSLKNEKKVHIIIPIGLVFTTYFSILWNVTDTLDHWFLLVFDVFFLVHNKNCPVYWTFKSFKGEILRKGF